MSDMLENVFSACSDGVICERDGKILYLNGAAKRLCPKLSAGDDLSGLFSEELTGGSGKYSFTVPMGGTTADVYVCPTEEGRLFMCRVLPEADMRQAVVCSNLGRAMRDSLAVCRLALELIRPYVENAADESLSDYTSMIEHGGFSVTRLADCLSRLGEDSIAANEDCAFDAVRVCRELTDSVALMTGKACAELSFEAAAKELWVPGYAHLIEEALLHLLSNSLKFTPKDGRVTVSVSRRGKNAVIKVTDTGSGIPDDVIGTVFRRYAEEPKLSLGRLGAGFGLAAVRRIVSAFGGSVMISSGKKRGTDAVITLPAPKEAEAFRAGGDKYENCGILPLLTILADVLPSDKYLPQYLD